MCSLSHTQSQKFNDRSTLVGHFLSSTNDRKKRVRSDRTIIELATARKRLVTKKQRRQKYADPAPAASGTGPYRYM